MGYKVNGVVGYFPRNAKKIERNVCMKHPARWISVHCTKRGRYVLLGSVLVLAILLYADVGLMRYYLSGCLSVFSVPVSTDDIPDILPEDISGEKDKFVALTFDDGPHPVYTQKLLEGLQERGVVATFFVAGCNLEKHPELLQEMIAGGHLVGNHTYHHVQLTKLNREDAVKEIQMANELIESVTGKAVEYIRPPYGCWDEAVMTEVGDMTIVLWNVDPYDWRTKNAQSIYRNVMSHVKNGDIILLHDIYESSVDAALMIVDELLAQGYRFVTVNELTVD